MDSGEVLSFLLFILKTIIYYNVFLYRYIITCCRTVVFPKLLRFSFCILVVKGAGRDGMWRQVIVQWISVGVTESDCSLFDSPVPPNTCMGGGTYGSKWEARKASPYHNSSWAKISSEWVFYASLLCNPAQSVHQEQVHPSPHCAGKLHVRHDTCLTANKFCRNL